MIQAVHPHACGEHFINDINGDLANGSSPRLWGTHHRRNDGPLFGGSSPRLWGTHIRVIHAVYQRRFIPTPVGNTLHGAISGRQQSVHPHACGEHAEARIP